MEFADYHKKNICWVDVFKPSKKYYIATITAIETVLLTGEEGLRKASKKLRCSQISVKRRSPSDPIGN